VPFDLQSLRTTGPPVAMGERALEDDGTQLTISDSGLLAYLAVGAERLTGRLVLVDAKGNIEAIPAPPRPYTDPAVSPDGRFAAVSVIGPVQTIWLYDFARRVLTPITPAAAGSSQAPVWTPDGKRIAYRGTRAGFRNLFWKAVDSSGEEDRLTTSESLQTPSSWSPDGKQLIYIDVTAATGSDILELTLDGKNSRAVVRTASVERCPAVSPDGKWLAYSSNESGADEVYVRAFAGTGARLQISTDGGSEPSWSPNGREVRYLNREKILATPISTQPSLSAGNPVLLFSGRYRQSDTGGTPGYGVAPDGRLLMVQPIEPARPANEITLVTSWIEELKRRVPANGR
jgi:Tol biopolymer transport system component